MTSVIASSGIAPVLAAASVRAEQVTQLVLGETAVVLERTGEWRRGSTHTDDYTGWIHAGYLSEVEDPAAEEWRAKATGGREGATGRSSGSTIPIPLRARVILERETARLPEGRQGRVVGGCVREMAETIAMARAKAPERWA